MKKSSTATCVPGSPKHFLDTSVARPMICGTKAQKEYFGRELKASGCYVSQFVRMEFVRGYIRAIVSFCATLDMPNTPNVGDALVLWSNNYHARDVRSVMVAIGDLLQTERVDFSSVRGKQQAINALARHARVLDLKFRGMFKDVGKDRTHCARARVELNVDLTNAAASLNTFGESFDDNSSCRSSCRVDKCLLEHYSREVAQYISLASSDPKGAKKSGLGKAAGYLQKIITKGAKSCTCHMCGCLGDVLIALDAPRDMQLEHVDKIFDVLCPPIDQPHRLHPSAQALQQMPAVEQNVSP